MRLRVRAEALSLSWSNVDLRRHLLTVQAAFAKTRKTRTVPMNSVLRKALARLKKTATGEHVFTRRAIESRSMLRRRLVCLLVVYVSLDFGNPLMPGTVTFEGGALEAATVECHRPAASAPLVALPSVQVPTVVPTLPSPSSPVRISAAMRRPIPTARRFAPPLEPALPAEDH